MTMPQDDCRGCKLFEEVCAERDELARRVLWLEDAINAIALNRLGIYLDKEGWIAETHPAGGKTPPYDNALAAVLAAAR